MKEVRCREFSNGAVYMLETEDGFPVEATDTFLPFYTKDAIGRRQNTLYDYELGDRTERWMIGISCMSGCPVKCKFCATGKLKKWRNLTAEEMLEQVMYIREKDNNIYIDPSNSKEFKINYTRMGEPFLNIKEVFKAIFLINSYFPYAHHYISTIGIKGSDYSWVSDNVTLQVSLHSLDESRRNWLIPFKKKMNIKQLGRIRTRSNLKTTLNLTLVDKDDFDIEMLKKYFDPNEFFIKLSPINTNEISEENELGTGIVEQVNLI